RDHGVRVVGGRAEAVAPGGEAGGRVPGDARLPGRAVPVLVVARPLDADLDGLEAGAAGVGGGAADVGGRPAAAGVVGGRRQVGRVGREGDRARRRGQVDR